MTAPERDTLVFVDVDRAAFEDDLLRWLPIAASTYRQQRGTHSCLAFRLPAPLPQRLSLKDANGEVASLRGFGSYQVGPGSLHPSGERYTCNWRPAIHLNEREMQQLIDRFRQDGSRQKMHQPQHHASLSRQPVQMSHELEERLRRWAQRGIEREVDALRRVGEGGFNNALFAATLRACRLASLAREDDGAIRALLYDAAVQAGYVARDGAAAAWRTIRSGMRAGRQHGMVDLPTWAVGATK
jgi:hypothetical protein